MIDRQLYYEEQPTETPWGELVNVPLNITEETTQNEEGEFDTHYRADVIHKVETPVTVEKILKAAINDNYTKDEQQTILVRSDNENDAMVKEYKAFIEEITKAAKEAGYKEA
jgi:hypothetical protein